MEFLETVKARRSIRKFTAEKVPQEVMERSFEAALLAPNSSNLQTWDFYWVQSPEKRGKLVQYCLNQSAARTAQELVVAVADPKLWKRSWPWMMQMLKEVQAPKQVHLYYEKLVPMVYRWGPFNSLAIWKILFTFLVGLFRPIARGPHTRRDLQEVAIKSAALACENFVLSLMAHGYSTCMMEGFDECRVKRLLNLGGPARVVMVIAIGKSQEKGTWGPQMRLPKTKVVHKV